MGVVVFFPANFAVLSSFFVALVLEFVIAVTSLMSLSLSSLSSMQSYMAFSSSFLLSYVSTLPFRRCFCHISTVVMVVVVNVKSLQMSSTPLVYVVFVTVVIIAVFLVGVVVFVLGNIAVCRRSFLPSWSNLSSLCRR